MTEDTDLQNVKRITANLPEKLLEQALEVTHRGITETLIEGLKLLKKRRAYAKGMALKGKLNLEIDIDTSRERGRS